MSDRSAERPRPARQTDTAESRRRASWYGHGQRTVDEKDRLGVFFDDAAYAFADVSLLSIPALSVVWLAPPRQWFGIEGAALVAWTAMVVVAALIRGGWVAPPATDALGWVTLTPWLVALRLGYYNAVLLVAAYGGSAVEAATSPVASAAFALLVGGLAAGLFPRAAESFYAIVAG